MLTVVALVALVVAAWLEIKGDVTIAAALHSWRWSGLLGGWAQG